MFKQKTPALPINPSTQIATPLGFLFWTLNPGSAMADTAAVMLDGIGRTLDIIFIITFILATLCISVGVLLFSRTLKWSILLYLVGLIPLSGFVFYLIIIPLTKAMPLEEFFPYNLMVFLSWAVGVVGIVKAITQLMASQPKPPAQGTPASGNDSSAGTQTK